MRIFEIGFLCVLVLLDYSTALKKCFPNPSMKCSVRGNNLISVYYNIHSEVFCSERCLDFDDCQWWTYHDKGQNKDGLSNSCELFRSVCNPVPSHYSRYDERCGNEDASFVTLVLGGLSPEGYPIEHIEVFDFHGTCENAFYIKRPIPSDLIQWKHASSYINYLNTIISCGGQSSKTNAPSGSCLIYDFNKFNWYSNASIVPNMLEPRFEFTMVYAYGEIFAMGGNAISGLSMEIYNPMTRQWREGPTMPKASLFKHCALKVKESIYIMGGQSSQSMSAETFMARYNVTNREWSLLAPMNIGRLDHACTFDPLQGRILVSGGQSIAHDPSSYVDQISYYDLRTGTWSESQKDPPSLEKRITQSITLYEGKTVILNGRGEWNALESIDMQESIKDYIFRFKLEHTRRHFSLINIPEEMLVTGCHA